MDMQTGLQSILHSRDRVPFRGGHIVFLPSLTTRFSHALSLASIVINVCHTLFQDRSWRFWWCSSSNSTCGWFRWSRCQCSLHFSGSRTLLRTNSCSCGTPPRVVQLSWSAMCTVLLTLPISCTLRSESRLRMNGSDARMEASTHPSFFPAASLDFKRRHGVPAKHTASILKASCGSAHGDPGGVCRTFCQPGGFAV